MLAKDEGHDDADNKIGEEDHIRFTVRGTPAGREEVPVGIVSITLISALKVHARPSDVAQLTESVGQGECHSTLGRRSGE